MNNVIEYERTSYPYRMTSVHLHDHIELYYQKEGEKDYFIEDRTYHLLPGDLIVIDQNIVHKAFTSTPEGNDRMILMVYPDGLKTQMPHMDLEGLLNLGSDGYKVLRCNLKEQEVVEGLLLSIERLMAKGSKGGPAMIGASLLLLDTIQEGSFATDMTHHHSHQEMNQRLLDITHYITCHYDEPLTLSSLAEAYNINRHYLCKLFSKSIGIGFSDYLSIIRIRKAKELLARGDQSMTAIAQACGFCDSSYFGKIFKKMVGTSPRKYRHHMSNE